MGQGQLNNVASNTSLPQNQSNNGNQNQNNV